MTLHSSLGNKSEIPSQNKNKREAKCKRLKHLQPGHVVEKKSPFSGKKFQQATEICKTKRTEVMIAKTMRRRPQRHFRELRGSASYRRLRGLMEKNDFVVHGQDPTTSLPHAVSEHYFWHLSHSMSSHGSKGPRSS